LLNDILDFSKMEAHKLFLETLDFDLHALLDDFAAPLALRAQEKGLEFICAVAPDLPAYLCGDPGRLRQVLVNLVGNAVKFTHHGEVAVLATLVSETSTQALIRFSIKDTGIGIPAEKRSLLFQKFSQVDASTTRQYGGFGLGLAISKQLVEMMGGEIGIDSEPGKGSEFWFTARFAKQPEPVRKATPLADLRGAHILVVDDNATNRDVLKAQLQSRGVRQEAVPDGLSALQALRVARDAGDPFQAVILDMQMPGMDGVAVARAIKSDETLKGIPLVLLTSLGQRGDTRHTTEMGFAACLTKPVRQADLFTCLATVLAGNNLTTARHPMVARQAVHKLDQGTVRILLAEDNITNQLVAVGILKNLGLRADAVANGTEAITALETLPYDLVLMDVQMPEMDGFEATRRIRNPQSAVRNHRVPIIAMTANAMQGDRERCLEAGMNDYVSKPVTPHTLAGVLEKWLPAEKAGVVFDRTALLERLMGDEELMRTVQKMFLETMPGQIELLRGCLEAGDTPGAERQAHSIRGAAANVSGETLRAVAFEMEKAAKAGDLAAATARMADLQVAFNRLKDAMRPGMAMNATAGGAHDVLSEDVGATLLKKGDPFADSAGRSSATIHD
jgi:CheY-like chemotaxis protein/HPt (histidine-containing phosphotransfer) domain-containing protein